MHIISCWKLNRKKTYKFYVSLSTTIENWEKIDKNVEGEHEVKIVSEKNDEIASFDCTERKHLWRLIKSLWIFKYGREKTPWTLKISPWSLTPKIYLNWEVNYLVKTFPSHQFLARPWTLNDIVLMSLSHIKEFFALLSKICFIMALQG